MWCDLEQFGITGAKLGEYLRAIDPISKTQARLLWALALHGGYANPRLGRAVHEKLWHLGLMDTEGRITEAGRTYISGSHLND